MNTDRDYIWAICFFCMVTLGSCLPESEAPAAPVMSPAGFDLPVSKTGQALIGTKGCTLLLAPEPELDGITREWAVKFQRRGFDVRIHPDGVPVWYGDLPVDKELCKTEDNHCLRIGEATVTMVVDSGNWWPERITILHDLGNRALGHTVGHEIAHLLGAPDGEGLMGLDPSIHYIDDTTLAQLTDLVTCQPQGNE